MNPAPTSLGSKSAAPPPRLAWAQGSEVLLDELTQTSVMAASRTARRTKEEQEKEDTLAVMTGTLPTRSRNPRRFRMGANNPRRWNSNRCDALMQRKLFSIRYILISPCDCFCPLPPQVEESPKRPLSQSVPTIFSPLFTEVTDGILLLKLPVTAAAEKLISGFCFF